MNTKKLSLLSLLICAFSFLFSLTVVSFHADISLAAFPLALIFTALTAFASVKKLFKENSLRFISVYRELLQYLPYVLLIAFVLRRAGASGAPFILDALSVAFWLASSVLALVVLHYLNPKRVSKVDKDWEKFIEKGKDEHKKNPLPPLLRVGKEILSWADALVQAVFMVLLLNIFIVQLYEIPSESMVPEFLIRDRVVVFKTLSGPKFPLSDVGLPCVKNYKRGDIVVFRNPHYTDDRKSEVRTFLSQIVYMCTLTTVNLNVDEGGNPKADPLVKRITGVPGEQLMMQDGVLYSRTTASDEWKAVEDDAKYAEWNLNTVKSSIKRGLTKESYVVSQEEYDSMIECEEERNAFSVQMFAVEAQAAARRFDEMFRRYKGDRNDSSLESLSDSKYLFENSLFSRHYAYTLMLLSSSGGSGWFERFMTGWIENKDFNFNGDLYAQANFKFNLMIKQTVGKLILRDAEMIIEGKSADDIQNDSEIAELMRSAQMLDSYAFLMDRRNMPVFPKNDEQGNPQYIPDSCYFMMGDNRFNSLDMRHSYSSWLSPLTDKDPLSVTYYSDMEPRYVSKSKILGTTSYRFWPLSRRGVPGHTGK